MTNDSLKTVEKLFKLHIGDGIRRKAQICKTTECSILKLKTM